MKKLLLFFCLALCLSACNNYEEKDLYGSWAGEQMSFTFNEDKSMEMQIGALSDKGRFRPFGNTLEIINSAGKAVSRITIKSLKNDSLVIDMPNISSRIYTLTRVKE